MDSFVISKKYIKDYHPKACHVTGRRDAVKLEACLAQTARMAK